MREVKFKAWLLTDAPNEGITPHMVDVEQLSWGDNPPHMAVLIDGVWHDQSEVVLMQSTGLKDKNGVEIFEGDHLENGTCAGTVIYEGSSFVLEVKTYFTKKGKDWFTRHNLGNNNYADFGWKIIGNIYENPELLESTESLPKADV